MVFITIRGPQAHPDRRGRLPHLSHFNNIDLRGGKSYGGGREESKCTAGSAGFYAIDACGFVKENATFRRASIHPCPRKLMNSWARLCHKLYSGDEQILLEVLVARWAGPSIGRQGDFDGCHGGRIPRPCSRLSNRQQGGSPRVLRIEKAERRQDILHTVGVVAGVEGQKEQLAQIAWGEGAAGLEHINQQHRLSAADQFRDTRIAPGSLGSFRVHHQRRRAGAGQPDARNAVTASGPAERDVLDPDLRSARRAATRRGTHPATIRVWPSHPAPQPASCRTSAIPRKAVPR